MASRTPTDEIRAIRHELAAKFDNDLDRIFADIQRQQRESGRVYVQLTPRRPVVLATTNESPQPAGGSPNSAVDSTTHVAE